MRKKIIWSFLTVLAIVCVWQWKLINYGIAQGKGQWKIIQGAVPVEDVLTDPDFPDSLKAKIQIIQKAKLFAYEHLHLKESDNYSTFYDLEGDVPLWNISASEAYSLTPKTWWFPVVGSVPYKGFFEKEKGKLLQDELQNEGWDTRMRPVGGWSTLGWFDDPILSNMLERSEGQLAELIIHELTHGTIFVNSQVEFNENLASFIGERGARLFLAREYGEDSEELIEYLKSEADSKKFRDHLLRGTYTLDSLYKSFHEDQPQAEKEALKKATIELICSSLDTINFHNTRYHKLFSSSLPNNAYFMSYLRYHSEGDSLRTLLEKRFENDLPRFILGQIEEHGT